MQHWHQQQSRQSSISLSHLPMVLFAQQTGSDDGQNSSRRVSSASTTSSLPRTPSSAQWDSQEYLWRERDPERLSSLREAFSQGDDASTSSPATPLSGSLSRANSSVLVRHDVEQSGWNVAYKSPVRSLSVLSPTTERYKHRITRSATTSGSVRLWPQLPGHDRAHPPLEEELSELAQLPYEETETDEEEENAASAGSQPPSESEDGALRRRRHIRRPMRAKQDLPRRLPPLPSSLVHSNSTAARFISSPGTGTDLFSQDPQDAPDSQLQPQATNEWDPRKRSHTISDPTTSASTRIRPLPSPNAAATTTTTTIPTTRQKVAAIPQLKLATLALRSSPSEADAVLTKTPNRRFNPMGSIAVAPPMPQDAGSKIDWDLIGDILEIDGYMGAATPIARPA